MPTNCVVEGCSSPGTVHFPKDKQLLKAWRIAINRQGDKPGSLWKPTAFSRICHSHFKEEDYRVPEFPTDCRARRMLKKGVIPSVMMSTKKSEVKEKTRSERQERRGKRKEAERDAQELHLAKEDIDTMDITEPADEIGTPATCSEAMDINWIGSEETIEPEPTKHEPEPESFSEIPDHDKAVQARPTLCSVGTQTLPVFTRLQQSKTSIEDFKDNPAAVLFYTGFRDYEHFSFFYHCLIPAIHRLDFKCPRLSEKNELFLTLMKLRCAKSDTELSIMFGISRKTVGNIFSTIIRFLYYHLQELTPWLPKEVIQQYFPLDFHAKYPATRVILDATEIKIQKPGNVKEQSATWSSYKNCNTLKTMIGVSPKGLVTYVSDTVGGHTSDRQIIERSDLVTEGFFERGDEIMSDRGIMVQDLFASKDVKVNTPTKLRGKSQLSSADVIRDRRVASKRIHVERVIGLAKTFKIIATDMHYSLRSLSDKIVFVCFAICNFKPCIVGKYS